MMAVALGRLIPTKPLHHHHHHQPRPRRRSPVISADMRRRRHQRQRPRPLYLPNYDLDQYINDQEQEEISGVGRAVLTALNSDTPPQLPVSESVVEEAVPGAVTMRGSDVLMALERASVRKERKRKKRGVVAGGGGGSGGDSGGGAAAESGEVRPVNVKSEWGKKLEELEWRLQEFLV
ncbi:hypothetical protein Syun_019895 [Stephania yunnanensis]|uniref:Uncharacterized protein n=1 Tax=Stephania yunnanensis TaxID=152371 RepID=A0AAP0IV08_9MAGN